MSTEQTKNCEMNLDNLTKEMRNNQSAVQEYASTRKNRLLLFGKTADKLKQAIDSNNGWTEKPIGPLGYYIQVKDKSWQSVLETVLGGSVTSYLVSNENDERLLRQLMSRCDWYASNVLFC
jgi:chromosome segregation ATPase